MQGSSESEVVLAFRAENEASGELKDIRNETRGADQGFRVLNRSAIATGLGFLGLGFGAKEAINSFQEFNQSQAELQARLDLLGPAAQKMFDDAAPSFRDIAATVATTERSVSEAFSIIIANSGGIAPSMKELAGAFDLARATGTDFETVAALIGQALQGNLDPLEQLLDPSGRRSIASLDQALERITGSSRDAISPIDQLTAAFRGLGDEIAKDVGFGLFIQSLKDIGDFALDALNPVQSLFDAVTTFAQSTIGTAGGPPGTTTAIDLAAVSIGGLGGGLGGVTGNRGIGEQAQQLVFNINLFGVGDEQADIDRLVRRIEAIIRNNNRDGINIASDGG